MRYPCERYSGERYSAQVRSPQVAGIQVISIQVLRWEVLRPAGALMPSSRRVESRSLTEVTATADQGTRYPDESDSGKSYSGGRYSTQVRSPQVGGISAPGERRAGL